MTNEVHCFNPVHKVRSVQQDGGAGGVRQVLCFNPVHKVRSVQQSLYNPLFHKTK